MVRDSDLQTGPVPAAAAGGQRSAMGRGWVLVDAASFSTAHVDALWQLCLPCGLPTTQPPNALATPYSRSGIVM